MVKSHPLEGQRPKRILIIHNPTAGRCCRGRFLKVKGELERLGCELTVKATTRRGDAEAFAREASRDLLDAVVAAGGDGTVSEVVNGLLGRNLPLGIIPLGTANVLAAEILLPFRPRAIAAVIAEGDRLHCHLGLANGRLFTMMAGVGLDAHVVKNISPRLKKWIGKGAYAWATLRELFCHTANRYQVTLAGRTFSAASVVIGKGHFYGGRYICTPDARLDRASFQVCLFKGGAPWTTMLNILGILRGKISGMANVTLVETDRLLIEGPPGDPVQGDGDLIACLPLEIRISEKTIDLLVPA
ncbi:MAG: lipid kinase [Rhodospirillaceae bacterium]|nr:MAG: lipid kinase [Rhodospirillaceae bacterium]